MFFNANRMYTAENQVISGPVTTTILPVSRRGNPVKSLQLLTILMCCSLHMAIAGTQERACADPCLKATIAALFIRSPFLSPFRVEISVRDGVATLQGTVSNDDERALAEETASGVDGITAVVNRIQVNPATSHAHSGRPPPGCLASDDEIGDRVRSQLYWHRPTHGMTLEISARDGVVTLRGKADSAQQARMARLIALNTCGVRQVNSLLTTN